VLILICLCALRTFDFVDLTCIASSLPFHLFVVVIYVLIYLAWQAWLRPAPQSA